MYEKNYKAAYIYAGATIFLWASSFPAVKYALNWFSPGSLMLLRFIVASATMLLIVFVKKARLPAREDVPWALAGGIIGIFGYMYLFNLGTNMVKSGISSFIIATAPIFSLILSAVFLKEKVRPAAVLGVFISAFGLLLVAFSQIKEFSLNAGLVFLLAASVFTSVYNIIQRKISFKYTPVECCTYSIIPATALMFIFLPELLRDLPGASPASIWIIVYLGVFPAALAYLSWNAALSKAKIVTNVTNFLYLIPFMATAIAYLFLGEVLSVLAFAGGVTIIAGMALPNFMSQDTTKIAESTPVE